jgi:hypothetical protein
VPSRAGTGISLSRAGTGISFFVTSGMLPIIIKNGRDRSICFKLVALDALLEHSIYCLCGLSCPISAVLGVQTSCSRAVAPRASTAQQGNFLSVLRCMMM